MIPLNVATLVLLPVAAAADETAFGIRMGTPASELHVAEKTSGDEYRLADVPRPLAPLQTYYAVATDKAGTCGVVGMVSFTGTVVGPPVVVLRREMTERYGEPDKQQPDPNVWSWSVGGDIRYVWLVSSQQPDGRRTAMVVYHFRNMDECRLRKAAPARKRNSAKLIRADVPGPCGRPEPVRHTALTPEQQEVAASWARNPPDPLRPVPDRDGGETDCSSQNLGP